LHSLAVLDIFHAKCARKQSAQRDCAV
jgi:hypothetical protein